MTDPKKIKNEIFYLPKKRKSRISILCHRSGEEDGQWNSITEYVTSHITARIIWMNGYSSVVTLTSRSVYRSDKLHRCKSHPRDHHLSRIYSHASLVAPTLSRFRTTARRQPGRLKRLPSTDYRMLKALPRTNHPAGSSRISEQSNDSVIRLNRFVDKILPSSVMNLIGSPHRRRNAMEELNYDERISGKCTDVAFGVRG